MEDLNIVTGVIKQNKQYLFDSRIEKEINEIKIEKERLDNEVQKYDNIVAILERLPNELGWPLPFLPVTSHAFFPGATLTNTNEVQVHIGDGWFTRCSAHHAIGICHRRQEKCRGTKSLLEEREQLLLSWLHAAQGKSGIAGGFERDEEEEEFRLEDTFTANEIEEFVTEEQYLKEKETHRQRVKEHYLKQRAIIKQKQQEMSNIDLWNRLEELEIEEASSGELRSISKEKDLRPKDNVKSEVGFQSRSVKSGVKFADAESSGSASTTPGNIKLGWDWNDGELEHSESESSDSVSSEHSRDEINTSQDRPHKLSFADHIETGSDETSVIEFAHTPVESLPSTKTEGTLKSPSDIYATYLELFAAKTQPKSILKRRSLEESGESWPTLSYPTREYESDFSSNEQLNEQHKQLKVLLDIVEKQVEKQEPTRAETQNEGKKISKFKSSRMTSKLSK